jgi:4-hydroxy-tetrahydrodipicolinate reductase
MIKIAIIGYGKMGKEIESLAKDFDYRVACIIDRDDNLKDAIEKNKPDVAIEFTNANAVIDNIKTCLNMHLPIVSGTTGWDNGLEDIKKYTAQKNGNVLWGSNFSLGVNIWFDFIDYLTGEMKNFKNYKVRLEEIHHIHKLDKPSGTAIQAAQLVMKHYNFKNWSLEDKEDHLNITSIRQGEEVGTHSVIFSSPYDQITLEHKNFSRKSLAIGALTAAKWIISHKGFYFFHDVYKEVFNS